MTDDAPKPDEHRAKLVDVTESPEARALVITGQSKPPEKPERFALRDVTGTAEGTDVQIIGAGPRPKECEGPSEPDGS